MMVAVWLFTIAAVVAAGGILIAFKRLMRGLQQRIMEDDFNAKGLQKDQTKYFLHVALIEAIPIFLIILGFMYTGEGSPLIWTIIGLLFVIGIMLISIVQIKKEQLEIKEDMKNLSEELKRYLKSIITVGYITTLGVPIISLVVIIITYMS